MITNAFQHVLKYVSVVPFKRRIIKRSFYFVITRSLQKFFKSDGYWLRGRAAFCFRSSFVIFLNINKKLRILITIICKGHCLGMYGFFCDIFISRCCIVMVLFLLYIPELGESFTGKYSECIFAIFCYSTTFQSGNLHRKSMKN